MRSEWREVKLKDVLLEKGYIRGPFGSALRRGELLNSGPIPVYEQMHAIDGIRDFRYYIDDAKYESLKRFTVRSGDLIVSCSGTVGCISTIKPDDPIGIVSQALLILRADPRIILPEYLRYYLTSPEGQHAIISRSSGSVQVNIARKAVIIAIDFLLPPLEIQKAIVDTLSCLDTKIELNNRINENLEAQAQAVFKSWFVDFEPFQDGEFVESELGLIPKGWRIGKVDDIVELHDSKRVPLSSREREGMDKIYPYYGAASLMDYVEDYIFDGINLLLGEDGTVIDNDGHPILQYVYGRFWVNNHAHVISSRSAYTVEHLYILFSTLNVRSAVTGAVQKKINQRNLKSIPIILPPQEIVTKYNTVIEPFFSQRRKLERENKVLSALRDTLLPKLMSGEIEVPID